MARPHSLIDSLHALYRSGTALQPPAIRMQHDPMGSPYAPLALITASVCIGRSRSDYGSSAPRPHLLTPHSLLPAYKLEDMNRTRNGSKMPLYMENNDSYGSDGIAEPDGST